MENKVFTFCKTVGNKTDNTEKLKVAFWKQWKRGFIIKSPISFCANL